MAMQSCAVRLQRPLGAEEARHRLDRSFDRACGHFSRTAVPRLLDSRWSAVRGRSHLRTAVEWQQTCLHVKQALPTALCSCCFCVIVGANARWHESCEKSRLWCGKASMAVMGLPTERHRSDVDDFEAETSGVEEARQLSSRDRLELQA